MWRDDLVCRKATQSPERLGPGTCSQGTRGVVGWHGKRRVRTQVAMYPRRGARKRRYQPSPGYLNFDPPSGTRIRESRTPASVRGVELCGFLLDPQYGSNGWTWQQPFRFGDDRDARGGRGSSFSTKPRILAAWGWVLLWDLSYDVAVSPERVVCRSVAVCLVSSLVSQSQWVREWWIAIGHDRWLPPLPPPLKY